MLKRKITTEDLYEYRWIADPAVNSAAGLVAYTHKTIERDKNDYRTSIRVVGLDGGGDRAFTCGAGDGAPAWSPDGGSLAFLRAAAGEAGRQIWLLPAQGGEARPLTRAKHGVSAFVWAPDGQAIAFTARATAAGEEAAAPGQVRVIDRTSPKAEGSGWWDGLYAHLFVLDVRSGRIAQVTSGAYDAAQPFWLPDGQRLGFLAKIAADPAQDIDLLAFNDVYTVRADGSELVKHTDSTLLISQACCSLDGRTIALIANDRAYGSATHNRIFFVREDRLSCITGLLEMQIGNFALSDMKAIAACPLIFADDSSVLALGSLHGSVHVYRFYEDGSFEQITAGDRDVYQFGVTADGRHLIAASTEPLLPGDLYRIDLQTREELRLTASNDAFLEQLELSRPSSFWFKTSDNWDVQGWIMTPPDMEQDRKYPLILQIHGGPHALYANDYSHEFQTLAAQGYVVLYTNPRGSFGCGQDFVRACRGDFGGRDYEDLMDAVDYALGHFGFIDETQLYVTGGSYGGFMTNWIVGQTRRFRAAVTDRSISNWLSFYGMSDIGISYTEGGIEGNPWDDPEKLWKRSPLAYVKQIETPLLILHGEQDHRCPIEQGEQLYVALKRLGKRTQFVRFPNANHTLLKSGKPSLRVERLNRIIAWFNDNRVA